MSEINDLPSNASQEPVRGSVCPCHRYAGIKRAALYTPVILVLSTLVGLAAFPELVNYAAPLFGDWATPKRQRLPKIDYVDCTESHDSSISTESSLVAAASACCIASPSLTPNCGLGGSCTASSTMAVTDELSADASAAVNVVDGTHTDL